MEGAAIGHALWLEDRRSGLGGTDAAAILGLSPYAGPLDVWLQKIGQAPPKPMTGPMAWGLRLEDPIASWYTDTTGRAVWKPENLVRHPEHDFIIGSPDRLVVDHPRGLEIKTGSGWKTQEWGEPGTDQVPPAYVVQCAHYMAITGFPDWDVAVLLGGSDARLYVVRRDLDLEAALMEKLTAWWKRHIVDGHRPNLDHRDSTTEYIHRRFPSSREYIVQGDAEATRWADLLRVAQLDLVAASEREATAKNNLKELIGEAAGIEGPGWKATWRTAKGRDSVDWSAAMRSAIKRVRPDLTDVEVDTLLAQVREQHTNTGEGARRFTFNWKG